MESAPFGVERSGSPNLDVGRHASYNRDYSLLFHKLGNIFVLLCLTLLGQLSVTTSCNNRAGFQLYVITGYDG